MIEKILLTVGTQLPFDRLVTALDGWAARHQKVEITAQIGDGQAPRGMNWKRFFPASDFQAEFEAAEVIVAHSGMGTILTCLDLGKPLIIMPRLASLGEHRNDHQLATARQFEHFSQVHVVNDSTEMESALNLIGRGNQEGSFVGGASPELLSEIRHFVIGEQRL